MSNCHSRLTAAPSGSHSRPLWPTGNPSSVRNRIVRAVESRYGGLPIWVLLVQIFLAVGWLRAAVAHGISADWWTGTELAEFRIEHEAGAVDWYGRLVLDGLVADAPLLVAVVVVMAQVTVALMLGLRHRTLLGLSIGAFLNINFVLAGAVDPSAFYLVLGAAVAVWHVEASVSTPQCWWLTFCSTLVGFTLIGSLAPQVTTIMPAAVTEDPAPVLIFLTLLWVAGLWMIFGRRVLRPDRDGSSAADRPGSTLTPELVQVGDDRDITGQRNLLGAGVPAVSNTILVQFGRRDSDIDATAEPEPQPVVLPPSETRPTGPQDSEREPVVLIAGSFEDAKLAADEFKKNVPVLLNVREVDGKLAGRLINVAIGICYSLGGTMEKMAPKVFLLIPEAVDVSEDERRRMEERILAG